MQRDSRGTSLVFTLLFGSLGLGLLGLAFVMYLLYQGNQTGVVKELIIHRGSSIGQVSRLLQENNIITHPNLFKALLRVSKGEQRVRAGEFRFHSDMSGMDALKVLYYGEPIVHSVTVPEGYNVKQIADALAASKLVDPKVFTEKALSQAYAQKYKFYSPNLEGYLFPDTYVFSRVDGEDKILDRMVQNFLTKTGPTLKDEARKIGLTVESLMTLASIIEKETGASQERELVSSVFHNRLKKGMKLQSDPTTIYSIPNYNGNITKADLHRYHPYNTYTIPGLPPGPIASPGLSAIQAALHPAKSDYLFFVANKAGAHVFSKTYSQHANSVNENQVRPNQGRHLGKVLNKNGKK